MLPRPKYCQRHSFSDVIPFKQAHVESSAFDHSSLTESASTIVSNVPTPIATVYSLRQSDPTTIGSTQFAPYHHDEEKVFSPHQLPPNIMSDNFLMPNICGNEDSNTLPY